MIKTLDPMEFCSRGEQSGVARAGSPRRRPEMPVVLGRDPGGATEGRARYQAAERIGKTLAYMLEHLDKQMHIAALGKIAGLSTSTFYQRFKTVTGCTPNWLFTQARMHRACGLLQDTNLSVKEIAAVLGYNDQFYFSRVFKSLSTVAPVHYRNLNRILQHEIKARLDPGNYTDPLLRTEANRLTDEVPSRPSFPAPQIKNQDT